MLSDVLSALYQLPALTWWIDFSVSHTFNQCDPTDDFVHSIRVQLMLSMSIPKNQFHTNKDNTKSRETRGWFFEKFN